MKCDHELGIDWYAEMAILISDLKNCTDWISCYNDIDQHGYCPKCGMKLTFESIEKQINE